jgi:predicted nucleic acid-binding protein
VALAPLVIDTTVLIDLARGHPGANAWARALEHQLVASEVTRFEILVGIRAGERSQVEQLLRACRWLPVDEAVSRTAADLARHWRKSHPGLAMADLLIAATAMELGAPLATSNVRHFPMFPGLMTPY